MAQAANRDTNTLPIFRILIPGKLVSHLILPAVYLIYDDKDKVHQEKNLMMCYLHILLPYPEITECDNVLPN